MRHVKTMQPDAYTIELMPKDKASDVTKIQVVVNKKLIIRGLSSLLTKRNDQHLGADKIPNRRKNGQQHIYFQCIFHQGYRNK